MKHFNFFSILFPAQSRTFFAQRWVNILLRTAHLVGIVGFGCAYLFNLPADSWLPYMCLTIVSGALMVTLEIWSNGIWLIQLRGLATLLKLFILSLTFWLGMQNYIIIPVIIISSVFAHAPAKVRYYSILPS